MNLKRVKKGAHLHWPTTIADGTKRYRGGEGYVLDMDAALEREWCAGQLYKLEDAPAGSVPSEITLANALGARKLAESKKAKPGPTVEAKASALGIMDPVEPEKAPTRIKAGARV